MAAMSVSLVKFTTSATLLMKLRKLSSLPTKSVSQFTSTIAPCLASALIDIAMPPSAAIRPAILLALAPLLMRIKSSALARSPSVSVSAFLHSIIPRPVLSLSSFTKLAVICVIVLAPSYVIHASNHIILLIHGYID